MSGLTSSRVLTSKRIMSFQATDCHRRQSSGYIKMFTICESQVAGNLVGKELQTKLRKSEDDFKFSASNGTAKANTVNYRQRLYSDHEYVKS